MTQRVQRGESSRRRSRLQQENGGCRTFKITTKKPRTKRGPKHPVLVLGTSIRQVGKPCLKLEEVAPTPSDQNNGAATREASYSQSDSPLMPSGSMEASTSPWPKLPKEPFTADQIWPINIRWVTPSHPLERVAYRQPSEKTCLFVPVECRRLCVEPCIGLCGALPVHNEALITAVDVFTEPLSHEEAVAAVDVLNSASSPCSCPDPNSGRMSPRAVRGGAFGPECWEAISEVGLPGAQPEDKAMALEMLEILAERKRGRAACGCETPSGSRCVSIHRDQQHPSELETPQESALVHWTDSHDSIVPEIVWDLCTDPSPAVSCTETGAQPQGLLASSLLLAQPGTDPTQDTFFSYVKSLSSRVCPA
ncbi:hypothetical protein COCOBI_03-0840 [Coccomyxa sp. Obi]|nr:hypothetical protein COCOBI_03-0840 [Coccomyxa sp. Obi]